MTSALFPAARPLTESEFLALGETPERVELFDGGLHVTVAPGVLHQHVTGELKLALHRGAGQAGHHVLGAVNVRLRPGRITVPDLVVTTGLDFGELVVDSAAVRLVGEVLSPASATIDRVLKAHYYAAAGIPWYLLAEPDTGTLWLHTLTGGRYTEYASAEPGELLRLTDPVAVTIDPAELLPPG
ncbi:Uma2 family endonuclease [Actinoplanes palleronii]|uniref:Putative restriction endonuclease domain-containing protein n=1 Tax=Actinoplanes palleronii TaxID=113570 RepID=A0ABQ4B3K3_9ACTN|nr:Uma2 family endonuclease [Actinoplanes palleronii]GIE65235.1 hypothetical protein Apa02nite_013430 [Actinoplanes palleronii]